jgi:hypothetical protein
MESKDKNAWKYLTAAGVLGLSYFMINYFTNIKRSKAKPLSLDQTKRILKEIKYQMLTTCFTYAEAVNMKANPKVPQ